jgi:hypothetical protein
MEYQIGKVWVELAAIEVTVDLLQIIEQDIFFVLKIYRSFYKPVDA